MSPVTSETRTWNAEVMNIQVTSSKLRSIKESKINIKYMGGNVLSFLADYI